MITPIARPDTAPEVALKALELIATLGFAAAIVRTQHPALAIETAKARILAAASSQGPISSDEDAQLIEHIDYLFDLVVLAVGRKE